MPTYNESSRGIIMMPLNQEESSHCYHMGPILALFFWIIRIISLLFSIILIIAQNRNCILVCIHCRKLANWHIHHRGSVGIQTMSIRDSFINLQRATPHDVSFSNLPIGIGHVRQPSSTQFRLELITQSIDSCCNGSTAKHAFPARGDWGF